jgi:hypothetical protein
MNEIMNELNEIKQMNQEDKKSMHKFRKSIFIKVHLQQHIQNRIP